MDPGERGNLGRHLANLAGEMLLCQLAPLGLGLRIKWEYIEHSSRDTQKTSGPPCSLRRFAQVD